MQAGFKTNDFPGYNDNLEIDKKISYIKDNYNENKIETSFKNLDYTMDDIFQTILLKTQEIIKADKIKPIELGIIYDIIALISLIGMIITIIFSVILLKNVFKTYKNK